MRNIHLLIVIISFFSVSVPVLAVEIGGVGLSSIAGGEVKAARAAFSGKTITLKRTKDRKGYNRDRDTIPFVGTFVAYFAPNGRVLVWGRKNEKIVSGRWAIGTYKNIGSSQNKNNKNLLCMDFRGISKRVPCMIIWQMRRNIYDSAEGNVFNLRAGAAVPDELPRSNKISRIKSALK